MRIDLVSIFPAYFDVLDLSLAGKARAQGLLDVRVHDLRSFTHDRHRTVDDSPYGGGAGMVMRPEPWGEAIDAILDRPLDQPLDRPSARGAPSWSSPPRAVSRSSRPPPPTSPPPTASWWPAAATRASTSA